MNKDILDVLFRKGAAYLDIETIGTDVGSPIHEVSILFGDNSKAIEWLPAPNAVGTVTPYSSDPFRRSIGDQVRKNYSNWQEPLLEYSNAWTQEQIKDGRYPHLFGSVPTTRTANFGSISIPVDVRQGGSIGDVTSSVLNTAKNKVLWIANVPFEAKHLGLAGEMSGDKDLNNLFSIQGKSLRDSMLVSDPGVLKARMIGQTTGDWSGVWSAIKEMDLSVPGIKVLDIQDLIRSAQSMGHQLSKHHNLGFDFSEVYRGTSLDIQANLLGIGKEIHKGVEDDILSQLVGEKMGVHLENLETMLERSHKATGASFTANSAEELDALQWLHKMNAVKKETAPIYAKKAVALALKDKIKSNIDGTQFRHKMSSGHEVSWVDKMREGMSIRVPFAKPKTKEIYNYEEVLDRIQKMNGNKGIDIRGLSSTLESSMSRLSNKEALDYIDSVVNNVSGEANEAVRNIKFSEFSIPMGSASSVQKSNIAKKSISKAFSNTPDFSFLKKAGIVLGGFSLGVVALGALGALRETDRRISSSDDAYNTIEGMGEDNYASYLRHQNTDFGSGWKVKKETFERIKKKPISFLSNYKERFIKANEEEARAHKNFTENRLTHTDFNEEDQVRLDLHEKAKVKLRERTRSYMEYRRPKPTQKRNPVRSRNFDNIEDALWDDNIDKPTKRSPKIKPKIKSQATPVMVEAVTENVTPIAKALHSAPKGSATSHAVGMSKGMKFGLGIAAGVATVGMGIMAFSGKGSNSNTIQGLSEQGVAGENRSRNTDFGSPYQGQFGVGLDIALRLGMSTPVYMNNLKIDQQISDFRDQQMQTPMQKRIIESIVTKQSLKSISSTYFLDPAMTTPVASGDYFRYNLNKNKNLQEVNIKDFNWAVEDADTLVLKQGIRGALGQSMSIRLAGIDSPEVQHSDESMSELRIGQGQPHGEESRIALQRMIANAKDVKLMVDPTSDTYGRSLGVIIADGKNLNLELVKQGFAGALPFGDIKDDIVDRNAMASAENVAYGSYRGMWKEDFWRTYKQSVSNNYKVTFNTLARVDKLAGNMNLAGLYSTMNLAQEEGMNSNVYHSISKLRPKLAALGEKRDYKYSPYILNYKNTSTDQTQRLKLEITDHMNQESNRIAKQMKVKDNDLSNTSLAIDSLTSSMSIYKNQMPKILEKYNEEKKDRKKLQGYMQRSANQNMYSTNRR